MSHVITPIKKGVIRISKYGKMPESYLERYGIVTVPAASESAQHLNIRIEKTAVILPNGRRISFVVRPEQDDAFWQEEIEYQLAKFHQMIPERINIIGRPQDSLPQWKDALNKRDSDHKFGISIAIDGGEKFYGLGEASKTRIQHRGGSYQNWATYQFDEIAIPLVYSNENWGLFILADGRHFVDIDDHAKGRLTVLGNSDDLNVFLLYGDSMKDLLRLYTDFSGKSMLLPKWGYGLTYIAPIHQNQFEIMNDMLRYRENKIPCDNVSLEPGWMTRFYDYSFDKNWDLTKFHIDTWMQNRQCEDAFPQVLRRFGFHLCLWFCVNYDLCDEEERQITGEGTIPAWYDHARKFVDAGVDGFKLDPADMLMRVDANKIYTNKKSELDMHNVSQVLVSKQVYQGFKEQMGCRPFLHYCGGYTGQQRWGAATTGDNDGLLGAMIWLESLAMSGFMNTTVDMDINSIASIHFAMLAPWAHHNAWMGMRQPWYNTPENRQAYIYYAQLRYRILPYLYSAAIEGHETAVPMIRPMPLEFQKDVNCAELSAQYMLGEYILLSAYTDRVYLPAGKWLDYWTGEVYEGPYEITSYLPPKGRGGAFFLKMGAVIPQWSYRDYVTQYGEEEIELHFYPYETTEYIFREDDGISLDYETRESCHTLIRCECTKDKIHIHIGDRVGDYQGKPQKRVWKILVHETTLPVEVTCDETDAMIII